MWVETLDVSLGELPLVEGGGCEALSSRSHKEFHVVTCVWNVLYLDHPQITQVTPVDSQVDPRDIMGQ